MKASKAMWECAQSEHRCCCEPVSQIQRSHPMMMEGRAGVADCANESA
jgi:hypothetical protein